MRRYGSLLSVICGDAREVLCEMPSGSVPCVVLDPFAGSGTVGVVAQKAGRRAILIDVNPDYCAMARERLRQRVLL